MMDFLLNVVIDSGELSQVQLTDMELLSYIANYTVSHIENEALLEKAACVIG